MRMINRLVEPTSGRITIDGQDVRDLPAVELRRGIGYVIQQVGLFPHLTVGENVAIGPRLLGWSGPRRRLGLSAGPDRPLKPLSGARVRAFQLIEPLMVRGGEPRAELRRRM